MMEVIICLCLAAATANLLLSLVNAMILIGLANFILKFSDNQKTFQEEHAEFQTNYGEFMNEVRGKKGLVEIVNRILPRP